MNNLLEDVELEQLAKEIERELAPKVHIKTLPKGRILWHTRDYNPNRPIEASPDYLFTSLQAQQSLLHGISETSRLPVIHKLKTLRPLRLIEFKTPQDQIKFAREHQIVFTRKKKLLPSLKYKYQPFRSLKPFTWDDVKVIKYICARLDFDGYIARWDQDQVTLCMNRVKFKRDIEIVKKFHWKITRVPEKNVTFKTGFYRAPAHKKFIKRKLM